MILELLILAKLLTMGGGGDDDPPASPPPPEPEEEATIPIPPVELPPVQAVVAEPEPAAPSPPPAPVSDGGKVKLPARFTADDKPLRTGPSEAYNIIATAKMSDDASVLAISPDRQWYFIWSDSGDGWVTIDCADIDGEISTLPVWPNPMKGYTYKPWCSVTRPTDLKNGFDSAFETLICIPPNTEVKVLAKSPDGFWVFIWSDLGDGWVPASAMDGTCVLEPLAVWHNAFVGALYRPKGTVAPANLNMHGAPGWDSAPIKMLGGGSDVQILSKTEAGDWYNIMIDGEDGWVPAEKINVTGDRDQITVV